MRRKTEQVVSLLDNSGEGYLSFGRDLRVDSEYSRACESMLGELPAGRDVAELLFGSETSESRLVHEVIGSVLKVEDAEVRENMLSLLPREMRRKERLLAVDYRGIGREKFMVILTDITVQQHMADLLELEQQHLKMVVLAVSDNRNFFEVVDSFREFLASAPASNLYKASLEELRRLYREVHTYKGLLAQFSFPATPALLHLIESSLCAYLENTVALETAGEATTWPGIDFSLLDKTFTTDLQILSNALGKDFLTRGRALVLDETQAARLEDLATRLVRGEPVDTTIGEVRNLLREIILLRKLRLTDALRGYDRVLQQMALRQEKEVQPLQIEGEQNIWVDPLHWKEFLQSLVHVFRNAVIHGLESPDIRWANNKKEAGRVGCQIRHESGQLYLNISDDGAGLDLDALRRKAAEHGTDGATALDKDAVADLVFMDQVSTQTSVTDLAGRGVGLSAVRQATHALGGTVSVCSRPGLGTTFQFILPCNETRSLIDHADIICEN